MNAAQAIINKLSEYDFVIAIDTSGSMGEPVKHGSSISRWQAVQESAMARFAMPSKSIKTAWAWFCSVARLNPSTA